MNKHKVWTEEEIDAHLGISTAVYQKIRLGPRQIGEIRQADIKRIEISLIPHSFDYRDCSQVSEVLGNVRNRASRWWQFMVGSKFRKALRARSRGKAL